MTTRAPDKRLRRIMLLAGLGFLHWLFGNLYETIVLGPNLLFATDRLTALKAYRTFFSISSPPFYYLPWSPISVALVWLALYTVRHSDSQSLRRWLTVASVNSLLALSLTIYLVTNVNLNLYYGSLAYDEAALDQVFVTINWLGGLRLLSILGTVYSIYRSYRVLSPL